VDRKQEDTMLSTIRRLPSPALVISAIALLVAVGGGSYAIASLNSGTVKKIATRAAKKQIRLKAPRLSVKHAGTADNATNATTSTDSSQLGGQPPSAYQSRVGGSCPSSAITSIGADGSTTCAHGAVLPLHIGSVAGGTTILADIGVLGLQDVCRHPNPSDTRIVFTNNGSSGASLNWVYAQNSSVFQVSGTSVAPNGTATFDFPSGRIEGQFIFSYFDNTTFDGQETTVSLHAVDLTTSCEVTGTAQTATFHD
jgi:hypothetical protein